MRVHDVDREFYLPFADPNSQRFDCMSHGRIRPEQEVLAIKENRHSGEVCQGTAALMAALKPI
jgi:hypothetical protein